MLLFIVKYRKILLSLLLIISIIGYSSYFSYNYGKESTAVKYEQQIATYNKKVFEEIQKIQLSSIDMRKSYETLREENSKSFKDIIKASKTKGPLVVYQNNTCVLTPSFIESINKAIDQANKNVTK